MDPRWFPTPDRPMRQGGPPPVLGVAVLCFLAFLMPSGKSRVLLTAPLMIYFISQQRKFTSGEAPEDYSLPVYIVGLVTRYVDFIVLGRPERDIWRSREVSEKPADEDVSKMTLWRKLRRSLSFWATLRGIGWNWQVQNSHQVPANASRRSVLQVFT